MSNKKTYRLKNIDCPNCAKKIENEIVKLKGVTGATVEFPTGWLRLSLDGSVAEKSVFAGIQKAVKGVEPEVDVVEHEEKGSAAWSAAHKRRMAMLVSGAALYALAFICLEAHQPWAVYFTLFTLSFLASGLGVVVKAVLNIKKGRVFDENLLMTVAAGGAFATGRFEEGAAVMLFYGVGEMLESRASARSVKSIEAAMDLRPGYANLVTGAGVKRVSPEEVQVDQLIEVRPGEKVPIDGVVMRGESFIDTKAITGEPVPRRASEGSEVLAGFVNTSGMLIVRADKPYEASSTARIIELIREADSKKARSERFITRFARYYTPAVIAAALLTALIPPLVFSQPFSVWVYRALTFLVISCPCALVISVPLTVFAGLGAASKAGILIKGGRHLETLADTDTVIFDKTGTLTRGVFEVASILPAKDAGSDMLLEAAATAEQGSNHPIARSIMRAVGESEPAKLDEFFEIAGCGVIARLGDGEILAGNEALLTSHGVEFERSAAGGTLVYVAQNGCFLGCIVVADMLKPGARKAVERLSGLGVGRVVMLTGDSGAAAGWAAGELGITEFHAELLPVQKAELLEKYEGSSKGSVVYAGDGINDAPVLARADVGIAMGGIGSDAAVEAADAVIMDDDPARVADAIIIAKRAKRIILQNIVFALTVKLAVMCLGAAGVVTMWEAVFADVGVALLAILNALRLLRRRGSQTG